MEELTVTITNLKTKVGQLISIHEQLKKDKERLSADNIKLLKVIDEQKSTISKLEKEKKEVSTNKNEEQEQIIEQTKFKINELVQEVDNCIALLK